MSQVHDDPVRVLHEPDTLPSAYSTAPPAATTASSALPWPARAQHQHQPTKGCERLVCSANLSLSPPSPPSLCIQGTIDLVQCEACQMTDCAPRSAHGSHCGSAGTRRHFQQHCSRAIWRSRCSFRAASALAWGRQVCAALSSHIAVQQG